MAFGDSQQLFNANRRILQKCSINAVFFTKAYASTNSKKNMEKIRKSGILSTVVILGR